MKGWLNRFRFRTRNHASPGSLRIVRGAVSASGEGAIAIGGSAEIVVSGHGNTVVVGQPRPDEQVTLDGLATAGRVRMVQRWHAAGVPTAVAAEFADTPQMGALPTAVATTVRKAGVVVLEGGFGAGKSLAAERHHQQDIAFARADAQAPIPVYLIAQHIQGNVIDEANRAAGALGEPAVRGVALVVDGLDEPGPVRGKELLDQALSWVASAGGERWHILVTSRPGLEMDPELRRVMPELAEDEAAALMDRLGGSGFAVHSQSKMVRSVLRQPLFAIIAAQLQRDREQLPNSPVAFLGALVIRALRDVEDVQEERAERLLRRLATACVNTGGMAAAADVGSPGEVRALLDTRLVVRLGDRSLAFALPVLEQYFAGQALLANGVPAETVQNVELLDRWRYGLAMAIASGGWESVGAVLDPLLRTQPGLAAWAVHEAIPRNVPEGDGPWPDLPASLVSQRLTTALEVWRRALHPAGDRIFLHAGWTGPVTVDAIPEGSRLGLHILRRDDSDRTPGLALPAAHRWSDAPEVRPMRASFGPIAVNHAAWPWQQTLNVLASGLHTLCERREFDLADCDAYTKERLWLAGSGLLKLPARHFTPLRADNVHQALRQHLHSGRSLPVRSTFNRRFTGRQEELIRIDKELGSGRWADANGMLHHPYAVPDQARGPHVHGAWDTYSAQQLRLRTEQVFTAAVEIYTAFVDTWFPHLKQVLGLASASPAALIADLYCPPGDNTSHEPPRMRLSLRPSPSASVTVRLVPSEDDLYAPAPALPPGNEPARSPWARPSTPVVSEPEVFDDTPAIAYAYAWLHEDLHRLHLTSGGPRTTITGLP
ncbi:hypothetical protein ACIRJS_27475 [Streptomyces sp. NPDC102340]|uniref:hypothetical protein n=1 Tax=unclassified Streptomyces TaxID=2593676 RepID=UPI0037F8D6CF